MSVSWIGLRRGGKIKPYFELAKRKPMHIVKVSLTKQSALNVARRYILDIFDVTTMRFPQSPVILGKVGPDPKDKKREIYAIVYVPDEEQRQAILDKRLDLAELPEATLGS